WRRSGARSPSPSRRIASRRRRGSACSRSTTCGKGSSEPNGWDNHWDNQGPGDEPGPFHVCNLLDLMAGSTGLEPATSRVAERRGLNPVEQFPRSISNDSRTCVSLRWLGGSLDLLPRAVRSSRFCHVSWPPRTGLALDESDCPSIYSLRSLTTARLRVKCVVL